MFYIKAWSIPTECILNSLLQVFQTILNVFKSGKIYFTKYEYFESIFIKFP